MKVVKGNQGITLIALVITIIVLLILAGVTLSFVAGENGILNRATEAVDVNEKAAAEEEANLLVADIATQYYEEKYVNYRSDLNTIDDYIQGELSTEHTTENGYTVEYINEEVVVLKNGKPISSGTLENGKVDWQKENKSDYAIATYIIKGYNKEKETIEIEILLKSNEDIKTVTYPDNHTESYEQKEVEIMYEVKDGQSYEFIAQTGGKNKVYKVQTKGTTVGKGVNSKEGLEEIAQLVSFGCDYENKTIKLANSIDLKCDETSQWTPIGSEVNQFKGTFDGNNKTISNIYIDSVKDYQALFGGNSGTIKNITITNGVIKSSSANAGGVVGYNTGTIENAHNQSCTVSVDCASASSSVGGICANNDGIIKQCSNKADVLCNTKGAANAYNSIAGGIVGCTYGTKCEIFECYNTGNVTATSSSRCSYVGGILGITSELITIENCYNRGNIKSEGILAAGANPVTYKYSTAGGIVGFDEKSLNCSYCYNTGTIESMQYSGGIFGCHNEYWGTPVPSFENLYYLETSASYILGNSADTTGSLRESEMKSDILFNYLNNGYWSRVMNNYPTLK